MSGYSKKTITTVQRLLSGKYTILILNELSEGGMKYNQILRDLDITSPTLTRQLKELEDLGLILRSVCSERPLSVIYSLTEIGQDFLSVIPALNSWGNHYIQQSGFPGQ